MERYPSARMTHKHDHFEHSTDPSAATSVASRFWDAHHENTESPQFWMAQLVCRSAINRRVTGNPNEWPLEWFARVYGPRPKGLSLGCGVGNLERSMLDIGMCEEITGIDFSPRSIEIAKERAAERGYADRLTYEVGDLNHLRLPRATYDVAFIHQALHHVVAIERLLRRVARSLKPDGILFLDEWTGPSMTDWSPEMITRPAALYDSVPRAWRRWQEFVPPVSADDPSEGIRSAAILPSTSLFFEPVAVRPYGGHLSALVMSQLDTPPSEALDHFLERWLAMEDEDLRANPSCGYHHVIIGRPRRGLSALAASAIGFTRHVRMGLGYRAASALNLFKWAVRKTPLSKLYRRIRQEPPPRK